MRTEPTLALVLDEPLSVDEAIAAVKHPGAGAVVVMLGCVRDHTKKEGAQVTVTRLEYEAYAEMAEKVMGAIVEEVCGPASALSADAPGLRGVVRHRVGDLTIGDLAVVVAVSAPHRQEAFAACARIIDRLKEDAPIWKREHDDQGVSWVGLGP